MKRATLLLILAVASTSALAHGSRHGGPRVSLGFHFGVPFYHAAPFHQPWFYYPPPAYHYYRAPVVVQPASPPVYVERSDIVPEGAASWHFCREANGYYPYVRTCPSGWQRVPAQPPQ